MRPNDLVWNYWVNNYLMGQDPPVFDILSWNADGTNLPAALHRQFLDIFEHNPLPEAGRHVTVLGTPIDLAQIKVPDLRHGRGERPPDAVEVLLPHHAAACRATSTFALSNAGHIASLVNPPGNPKASYFTGAARRSEAPTSGCERAEQAHRFVVGALGRLDPRALWRARAGTRATGV